MEIFLAVNVQYERIVLVVNEIFILLSQLFLVMWIFCIQVGSFSLLFLIRNI